MARRNKPGDYSYTRTAQIRGREAQGRFAVIEKGQKHTRVAELRPNDGGAIGDGFLVPTGSLIDIKPTQIIPTGQRGVVTLPQEMRRELGIEEGTPLEVILEGDGRLSIRPLSRRVLDPAADELNDLLAGVTPENLHGEIPTGAAVGREAW